MKMFQQLKEYALGQLKNRIAGGLDPSATGDAAEVAASQPVPGAEDLENGDAGADGLEMNALSVSEGAPVDEEAELLRMLEEAGA